LTGRQGSTTFSSLNVSYVNSPIWSTIDGTMNVPVIVVQPNQQFLSLKGILTYSFSNMKLLPRNNQDISDTTTSTNVVVINTSKVYPNPINSEFIVENLNNKSLNYNITNVIGVIMTSGKLQSRKNNLKLNLNPGIYYLNITDDKYNIREKIRISVN
jgi:hypothetical protein